MLWSLRRTVAKKIFANEHLKENEANSSITYYRYPNSNFVRSNVLMMEVYERIQVRQDH